MLGLSTDHMVVCARAGEVLTHGLFRDRNPTAKLWGTLNGPSESNPGAVLGECPVKPVDNVESGETDQPGSGLCELVGDPSPRSDNLAVQQPGTDHPSDGHDDLGIRLDEVDLPGSDPPGLVQGLGNGRACVGSSWWWALASVADDRSSCSRRSGRGDQRRTHTPMSASAGSSRIEGGTSRMNR